MNWPLLAFLFSDLPGMTAHQSIFSWFRFVRANNQPPRGLNQELLTTATPPLRIALIRPSASDYVEEVGYYGTRC
jgi:hypothetical protein